MFKARRFPAFAAMLILSSSLCATPVFAQYEYDDESSSSAQDERPVTRTPVGGNASTARLQVRINELEEQVRRLQGALEQASFGNKQLKSQMDKMKGDIDFRLTALEKGAPAGGAAMTTTAEQPQTTTTTAAPVNNATINDEPEEPVKQPETSKAPVPKFDSSSEHYSYAFKLMNQAKYAEAGNAFDAFTERYSKDPLIGNAFYWLGETYYVRKDYVKAADSFRQGFEAMPNGPKAGDNLFKLAKALGVTGKEKESCIVLKQVLSKFGKTSGTLKSNAEQEMNRLDCRS